MAPLKAALTFRFPHKAEPYAEALRQAGIQPVLISPDAPRELSGLQGLMLSGGTDVNPARYGVTPHPGNEAPDDARDDLEIALLAEALARGLPVLAICRGMQLLNVARGGTLIQHLQNSAVHCVHGAHPERPAHPIFIDAGTRMAAMLGKGRQDVNSRHHQAVDRVGSGLVVTARCVPDGVIEALELPDHPFVVAVQWHPEDQALSDASQRKLFEAFGEAMRQTAP